MSLSLDNRSREIFDGLAPRLLQLTQQAAKEALRLHADEVAIEHLLCAAMRDEDSAAYEVVCHAFADPDTIFEESLALAPGLLVVASASTLPFSEGAVRSLFEALGEAQAAGDETVSTAHLSTTAYHRMTETQRTLLKAIRFEPDRLLTRAAEGKPAVKATSLFSLFDEAAKKALSRSNRAANSLQASEIGPVHLFMGCLQIDEALAEKLGLTFSRARLTLGQDHLDPTLTPERKLPLDAALSTLLEELPSGTDSLGFLAALHAGGDVDLATLLGRHKVTPELLERSQRAFRDPE